MDSAQLEIDGAASLKSVVTAAPKRSVRGFIIRSIVVMEAVTSGLDTNF